MIMCSFQFKCQEGKFDDLLGSLSSGLNCSQAAESATAALGLSHLARVLGDYLSTVMDFASFGLARQA